MTLKILMIAPQPFFRARGTPFSVLHRIRALVEKGHIVDLVTYPFGEDVDLNGLHIFRASRPPFVRDVVIGPSLAKIALDWPLFRQTVKMLKQNSYDVIHSHEEAAFFCVGLARKYNIPHLYDMHSSLPQQLENFERFNVTAIQRIFQRLEDKVLSTCDGVITICDDLARIAEAKCPETPHEMIENIADDQKVFPATELNVREQLGLESAQIALYTGTFEAYQGLDMLRDAFAIVAERRPEAHLVLAGGRPNQVHEFRAKLKGTPLQNRVTLVGTVHPSKIPAYFKAADLIVSPRSSGTNTPLKIYGYMRSGKPIVATDRLTHTQILTSEMAELVPASDEGLAAGMIHLFDSADRRRELAHSARAFAEREFSDAAYIGKVISVYDRMLQKVKSAHGSASVGSDDLKAT